MACGQGEQVGRDESLGQQPTPNVDATDVRMLGWVQHGTGGGPIVVGSQIKNSIDIAPWSYDFGQLVVGHVPPVKDGLRHEVSHDDSISRIDAIAAMRISEVRSR